MSRIKSGVAAWLLGLLVSSPALAVECRDISFEGNDFTICEADAQTEEIRLFLNGPEGALYGHLSAIAAQLATQDARLSFAMNGGMYHDDRSPVGHYVEDRKEQMRVIPNAGPGNFGLLPNGIFCIREDRADVIETLDYVDTAPDCLHATQSGPMLVIDGELHPRFLPDSTSRYIRNGVGTDPDGRRVVFAISNDAVTFHEFGRLFREELDVANALFLDGNISRLYAPQLDRSDFGWRLGPIIGIVERN